MKVDPRRHRAVHRRWIGALLFVSIFFLPLHSHVATAATAQLSKECNCAQGTRTQVALSPSPAGAVAQFAATDVAVFVACLLPGAHPGPKNVRAPPASL